MPNPSEICTVRANGQRYDNWETVEVHHSCIDVIDHALLTVSEISSRPAVWSALKLAPGDQVSIDLAGINVLDGFVYLRQAAYDKRSHAVQIGVASKSQPVVRQTVAATPGQYKNQTLQQIGSAVFGKAGVGFNVMAAEGAEKVFERVSESVGQTCFAFVENLCRLRNMYMIDDGHGTITAFRGPQGTAPDLEEGRNILRARLLMKVNEYAEDILGFAQKYRPGSGPEGAQIKAEAKASPVFGRSLGGSFRMVVEDAADKQDAQLRVNHQADRIDYETLDGTVTVPGWFAAPGDLWWPHTGHEVSLLSPMLLPGNRRSFILKEVIHRQSRAEGTTTELNICNLLGLGGRENLYG